MRRATHDKHRSDRRRIAASPNKGAGRDALAQRSLRGIRCKRGNPGDFDALAEGGDDRSRRSTPNHDKIVFVRHAALPADAAKQARLWFIVGLADTLQWSDGLTEVE
jgi:hypothetical protein